MKNLRIGMIGAGSMGREHIRRINTELRFATVTKFYDAFPLEPEAYYGALLAESEDALIQDAEIDAIMICSPDATHKDLVCKCLNAQKPVFCEKPLALTAKACMEIMQMENALGKKLVQVGFMRRYDPGYQKMRELLALENYLNNILLIHSKHRGGMGGKVPTSKPIGGPGNTNKLSFIDQTKLGVTNGPIHDVDICRYLIGDDQDRYASARITFPRSSKYASSSANPCFITLKTEKGIVVTIESFGSFHTSYDIQCEVVCEDGIINLPSYPQPRIRRDMMDGHEIPTNWFLRFNDAYDREIQHWIDSVHSGELDGPCALDAYYACCATDAIIRSIDSGMEETIFYDDIPPLYT